MNEDQGYTIFSNSECDHQSFLASYWQKQPLILRSGLPNVRNLITTKELFSLASNDELDIPCRIVQREAKTKNPTKAENYDWQLDFGPFDSSLNPEDFDSSATLLVNQIDSVSGKVADLLQNFSFLPSWRIDDIMVSWANDGGTVGPHVDQYDVFLVQAEGERLWRYETKPGNREDLEGFDLSLLKNFEYQEEVNLQCGDILYLPPGLAHYGISLGESLNYSVGFRAPSTRDLLEKLLDDPKIKPFLEGRYRDVAIDPQNPDLISAEVTKALLELVHIGKLVPKELLASSLKSYLQPDN